MAKPRSDSILKARAEQSEEFGDKLWEWLNAPKTDACSGGMKFAREQLAADGIELGGGWLRQLSEFRSWWGLKLTFRQAESNAQMAEQMLRDQFPEATPEKIAAAGQLVFTMQAANAGDASTFKDLEYLRVTKETAISNARIAEAKLKQKDLQIEQKEREIRLAHQKYQRDTCRLFLKWHSDEQAKQIVNSGGTNAEKIEALGRAMFGEDWDDEA